MERLHTDAVILRIVDHGEGHRIVELLTRESGVIGAFAPGAQRSRRRFGGALEPTHLVRVMLKPRPGRDLMTLEEASIVSAHPGLRTSVDAFARASWVVDVARSLAGGTSPNPELYDLVVATLDALDAGRLAPFGLVAFELAALGAHGSRPRFDACTRCGRVSTGEEARFSPADGGLLCPSCAPRWGADDVVLGRGTRAALVALSGAGDRPEILERAAALPDDAEAVAEAHRALRAAIVHVLGRRPKSLDFLERMEREGGGAGGAGSGSGDGADGAV